MALIVDCILILIIFLSAWMGYKRGIVKTAVKFGLLLISVVLAKTVSGALAASLSNALPMPGIGTKLASYLNINIEKLENMSLAELLTDWGFPDKAARSIEEFVGSTAQTANESITRQVTPAIDRLLTEVLLFAFLLIVFWLITILLTTLVNNVFELPVLSTVNHATGLAAGAVVGLLSAFVIVFIMVWSFPLLDASLDVSLTERICDKSFMIGLLRHVNPFMSLFG